MLEFLLPLFSGSTIIHCSQVDLVGSSSLMELLVIVITTSPLLKLIWLTVLISEITHAGLITHSGQMRPIILYEFLVGLL